MELKIVKCGEGLIVTVPDELLKPLGWGLGDILTAEIVGNGLRIERSATAHDHTMAIARKCFDEYREVFVNLAKT